MYVSYFMIDWLLTHSPLLYFTQSLWRDEAFSILAAQKPLAEILPKLSFEPPVYYILLHYWINIFGNSEIATRSLSLVGFALATVVVIIWAEKLFVKHWLSWFTPLFFFLNPLLLYYAFEVRTYGWYIFFTTLTLYTYWYKRWPLFVVAATLGFYTHSYFLIVPATIFFHWALSSRRLFATPKKFLAEPLLQSLLLFGLLITPWLIKISKELGTLKNSWYYPVDTNLITSVLGNLFIGYEGTPWYLWGFTKILSVVLLLLFLLALQKKQVRSPNGLFFLLVFLPLMLVIGVSFIKPIFVNRYVIPVTIAEVFLVVFALDSIRQKTLRKLGAITAISFVILVNILYPSLHAKLDIRKTIREINAMAKAEDVLFAQSSLVFLETLYYSNNRSRVFFYDPDDSGFPWYVGSAVFSQAYVARKLPVYPARAFLVQENGTYSVVYRTAVTATMPANLPKPSNKKI